MQVRALTTSILSPDRRSTRQPKKPRGQAKIKPVADRANASEKKSKVERTATTTRPRRAKAAPLSDEIMVGSGHKGNIINPFDSTSSSHVDGEDLIYADDIVGNNDVEDFAMESYQ